MNFLLGSSPATSQVPTERAFGHKFDETAFLEFGKRALSRSARNVAAVPFVNQIWTYW
jgi:hypothetical protein